METMGINHLIAVPVLVILPIVIFILLLRKFCNKWQSRRETNKLPIANFIFLALWSVMTIVTLNHYYSLVNSNFCRPFKQAVCDGRECRYTTGEPEYSPSVITSFFHKNPKPIEKWPYCPEDQKQFIAYKQGQSSTTKKPSIQQKIEMAEQLAKINSGTQINIHERGPGALPLAWTFMLRKFLKERLQNDFDDNYNQAFSQLSAELENRKNGSSINEKYIGIVVPSDWKILPILNMPMPESILNNSRFGLSSIGLTEKSKLYFSTGNAFLSKQNHPLKDGTRLSKEHIDYLSVKFGISMVITNITEESCKELRWRIGASQKIFSVHPPNKTALPQQAKDFTILPNSMSGASICLKDTDHSFYYVALVLDGEEISRNKLRREKYE